MKKFDSVDNLYWPFFNAGVKSNFLFLLAGHIDLELLLPCTKRHGQLEDLDT